MIRQGTAWRWETGNIGKYDRPLVRWKKASAVVTCEPGAIPAALLAKFSPVPPEYRNDGQEDILSRNRAKSSGFIFRIFSAPFPLANKNNKVGHSERSEHPRRERMERGTSLKIVANPNAVVPNQRLVPRYARNDLFYQESQAKIKRKKNAFLKNNCSLPCERGYCRDCSNGLAKPHVFRCFILLSG